VRVRARTVAILVGIGVLLLGVVLVSQLGADPSNETSQSRLLSRAAPGFRGVDLEGSEVTRASLAGKAVIVNFWNTWCIPCRDELPALRTFFERHSADGDVALVGIVRDDTRPAVRRYVESQDIGWTVLFDPADRAALDFGTRGQPETFAITPDGVVTGVQLGPTSVGDLERLLRAARGGP
jgi:cytochrome c biogenesis protein CcmG/thiol:disulfide interchange protein DsbE